MEDRGKGMQDQEKGTQDQGQGMQNVCPLWPIQIGCLQCQEQYLQHPVKHLEEAAILI